MQLELERIARPRIISEMSARWQCTAGLIIRTWRLSEPVSRISWKMIIEKNRIFGSENQLSEKTILTSLLATQMEWRDQRKRHFWINSGCWYKDYLAKDSWHWYIILQNAAPWHNAEQRQLQNWNFRDCYVWVWWGRGASYAHASSLQ